MVVDFGSCDIFFNLDIFGSFIYCIFMVGVFFSSYMDQKDDYQLFSGNWSGSSFICFLQILEIIFFVVFFLFIGFLYCDLELLLNIVFYVNEDVSVFMIE